MGPSLSSLNNGRWLPSAGVGYRFEFKPRVNVRLDYGIGNGSSGFYFQVGEAFLRLLPLIFSLIASCQGRCALIFMNCSFCDPNCSTTQ
ncbi:hypothetical protein, partial [Enterococcus faecalis]|uniref:hypothetical protein n=1 Tax=Enterococcus faecalis TaxID=1351 RepID=UPI003D6B9243